MCFYECRRRRSAQHARKQAALPRVVYLLTGMSGELPLDSKVFTRPTYAFEHVLIVLATRIEGFCFKQTDKHTHIHTHISIDAWMELELHCIQPSEKSKFCFLVAQHTIWECSVFAKVVVAHGDRWRSCDTFSQGQDSANIEHLETGAAHDVKVRKP